MTTAERLQFCRLCFNRTSNLNTGVLCKLTNEKPNFVETCVDFHENPYERKQHEQNLFHEKIVSKSLFETNLYPTNNWLISLTRRYLPKQFKIKNLDINIYITSPIIITSLLLITIFMNIDILLKVVVLFTLAIITTWMIIKNWNSMIRKAKTIALVDDKGIQITDGESVSWNLVELVYINNKVFNNKVFLVFEVLGIIEPIKIRIDKTVGSIVLITVIEAYRKNKN